MPLWLGLQPLQTLLIGGTRVGELPLPFFVDHQLRALDVSSTPMGFDFDDCEGREFDLKAITELEQVFKPVYGASPALEGSRRPRRRTLRVRLWTGTYGPNQRGCVDGWWDPGTFDLRKLLDGE